MENEIFRVGAGMYKSVLLKNNELWFSVNEVRSIEKFEKAANKTGILKSTYIVSILSISLVSYNEGFKSVKIKYKNQKGEKKKLNIEFRDNATSNNFGEFLGEKLELTKSSSQERRLKPVLLNGLYLTFAIVGTFVFGMMEDTSEITDSSRVRRSGSKAIFKLIVDTIGQTGVFFIGGLVSLYFVFQLFKRFKNPSHDIIYTK